MATTTFSTRNFLEINLAMLLMGTSGPFGKYIALPVALTIGIRALLALVFLVVYCKIRGISFRLSSTDRWPILVCGILMGLHWITYFQALQLSNVAIGMLSMFTYPVITSFLEPIFLKTKFQKIHVLLGVMVLFGVYLLVPNFTFDDSYTIAITFGLLSALVYAIRNLILKTKVDRYEGALLMTYQMAIVCVGLIPVYFIYDVQQAEGYWPAILGLVLVTTVGHTMLINCFKYFSITTISILSSITPVYGILIGALFLSEIPGWSTIIGGTLILASVVVESVRSYR